METVISEQLKKFEEELKKTQEEINNIRNERMQQNKLYDHELSSELPPPEGGGFLLRRQRLLCA